MKHLPLAAIAIVLSLTTLPARTQITIDTSNATDWKISNGVITVDWLPGDGRIFSMHWTAFPNQKIIDVSPRIVTTTAPKGSIWTTSVREAAHRPTIITSPRTAVISTGGSRFQPAPATRSPGLTTAFSSPTILASTSTLSSITVPVDIAVAA